MIWSIAARPSSYKKHAKKSLIGRLRRKIEYAKAQMLTKVEHPFRVIKRQFGYKKVRFRGLSKNIAQQTTLFAFVESVDGAKTVDGYGRAASVMRTNHPGTVRLEERFMR
jgi:hypothetical protein